MLEPERQATDVAPDPFERGEVTPVDAADTGALGEVGGGDRQAGRVTVVLRGERVHARHLLAAGAEWSPRRDQHREVGAPTT